MNPFDPALLERLTPAVETPPATLPPALPGWRSSVYAVWRPGGVPEWRADWELTQEAEAAEWAVVEALSDLTTTLGPWDAARRLFAPDAPCASLRAT